MMQIGALHPRNTTKIAEKVSPSNHRTLFVLLSLQFVRRVTSIMRPYERAPKGRDTHDESDENLWVVDYMTLCDQIYVCDWIKE